MAYNVYWPGVRRDLAQYVEKYVKTCHTCQVIGKPNQKLKAPLFALQLTLGAPCPKPHIETDTF